MPLAFRHLTILALCTGLIAGLALFVIQHFTIVPLIEAAEQYEKEDHHHDNEWKPAEGWERAGWTALTTLLTSIGFAAIFIPLTGRNLTPRKGAFYGLAAFICIHLAPALGLPPVPPGVPVADVQLRQLWWLGTVIATAAGLWLATRKTPLHAIAAVALILLPHLIGAPAVSGESPVPQDLIRKFTFASLATAAIHWLLLGVISGAFIRKLSYNDLDGLASTPAPLSTVRRSL